MTIVIGIDPGSLVTGYGIIRVEQNQLKYLDSGCIRMSSHQTIPLRLKQIHDGIAELIAQFQPNEAAIEEVFMGENPGGALKLGQARGAAITTLMRFNIEPAEYSAREIKQAVVGYGAAGKEQVQAMVKTLLKLPKAPVKDAADALAVAICHVNTQKYTQLVNKALKAK
jgi:crossover junction endodeoxyribonuclease RuvC